MEKINITLEAARVNAGYTQEQAASNLGVSRSTIINWENGKTIPGIPSMHKMSQLYGIPLDCIFYLVTLLIVELKPKKENQNE